MIIPSVEINHRVDFPLLANARGIRKMVEVGTDRGIFARQIMQRFEGELICVDPYEPFAEHMTCRAPDLLQAALALQPWFERVRFLQAKSPEIACTFPAFMAADPPVRLVYIDGAHDYSSVAADIVAWWNFLPANGILAGHDFDDSHPGVKQAVSEFACERTVRLTAGDNFPSWYAYKTEPATIKRFFWESREMANDSL